MTTAESVGDASFRYQVSADQPGEASCGVVSTGHGRRRSAAGSRSAWIPYNGEEVFADEAHDRTGRHRHLTAPPDIRTDVGTNGSVTKNGSGTLCGDVRHGTGKTVPQQRRTVRRLQVYRRQQGPAADRPAGEHRDDREFELQALRNLRNQKAKSTPIRKKRDSTNPWDAEKRTINVSSNATLTMGGGDYFVCGLYVDNGQMIMAGGSGVQVRIFFDTPENCGLKDGDTQVSIGGNANIVSTGYNPSKGMFNVPGLYVQGSTDDQNQHRPERRLGHQRAHPLCARTAPSIWAATPPGSEMMAGKSINTARHPEVRIRSGHRRA